MTGAILSAAANGVNSKVCSGGVACDTIQPKMPIHYRISPALLLPRLPSLAFRRRSAYADFTAAFKSIGTSPIVKGAERIPERGPFIALMNHYHVPEIRSWWFAMAMCQAIGDRRTGHAPHEPHMLVATEWTYPDWFRRATIGAASAFAVGRIIHAYGYLRMEPPVLGPGQADRRAHSIRAALEAAREAKTSGHVLGIAPEGGDTPDGVMVRPPPGAGRFLLLLAAVGLPCLPFGLYLDGDRIVVNTGEMFELSVPRRRLSGASLSKDEVDEAALCQAMGRIAQLVPNPLRGYYAPAARELSGK